MKARESLPDGYSKQGAAVLAFFDICKERQAVDKEVDKEVNDQAIAKAREDPIKAQTAVDEIVKRQPDATKWSTADLKTILTSQKRKTDGAMSSLKRTDTTLTCAGRTESNWCWKRRERRWSFDGKERPERMEKVTLWLRQMRTKLSTHY